MTADTMQQDATETRGARLRAVLLRQDVILLGVLVVMVAFFTTMNPLFFTRFAFANILQDWAPVMLLAIGQTYVIITGGIDLSVGSTLGLSGVAAAMTMRSLNEGGTATGATIAVGVVVALATGLAVGLVNGLLITRAKLAPFIATLATMGAGAGLTLVLTGGVQVAGGPAEVIRLGNTQYLNLLTIPLVIVFAVLAVAWLVLSFTRFGRWTYAVGSNGFAARGAGIGVDRHLLKVYMLAGLMAGLAGLFVYFRLGSGSPTSGQGQELAAIAAAVIGGTSLIGGSGRMSGTVLGALITTAVLSGLILIGVAPNWQQVVIGLLIAVAVGVQQINVRTRKGAGRG
ncbi:ABC transporter permease [Micromonospora sp. LH3U1]|uniref:ABC transporter permease n=1 Tax=Micromonospora sp. LH3U1 TaxID=3018339 RepID=UPI00234BCD73|nr:ABC transporter permease [Micromonospora sp. LH3U1]WCN82134.1 ABC transporter permease [Micromonospora sp. LH3U1]